ncbi:MAG: hypothetical protein IPP48_14930 [Chitinophagaceae bacterium]|nr:hypothetical protein [Chitinophagaceae bacterium]
MPASPASCTPLPFKSVNTKSPIEPVPIKPKSTVKFPLVPSPSTPVAGSPPLVSVTALLLTSPATLVFVPLLSLSVLVSGSPPFIVCTAYPVGMVTPTM